MKGSIKSQVYYLIKQLDGIGKSKKEIRNQSEEYGQNGRKVSPLIHSYKYQNDIKNTAKQLMIFAKENYQVKNCELISNDILENFIKQKVNSGLTYRTISTYIGHLQKISLGLKNIANAKGKPYKAFDENGLKTVSNFKQKNAKKSKYINRSYINVDRIISNLENFEHILVAKMQLESGVRATEALRFRPDQLKNNNQIEVKIKGGNTILVTVSDTIYNTIEQKIIHAIANKEIGFKVEYYKYYKDLKRAVKASGETWTGTHGMRYTYAQRRINELANDGIDFEKAQLIVSKEMGHKRAKITSHYLG